MVRHPPDHPDPALEAYRAAQLIKTDAQLDAAAKLFAEAAAPSAGMCAPKQALQNIRRKSCASAWKEERKAGWAFYLHTTSDTPDGMVGVCHKTGEIGTCLSHSPPAAAALAQSCWIARKKLAEHARPWLAVLDVNTAAIGLYRRMGYLPDGVRNMYQPGVDVAFCKPCKELVMRYQPRIKLNLRYSVGFSYRFCSLSTIRLKINW